MDISSLAHFRLEGCRFSRSSYSFEFDGNVDGRNRRLIVSTPYSVSSVDDQLTDAAEVFSAKVWRFLESKVTNIAVDESAELARVGFFFDVGGGFVIWARKPLTDNLLLVRDVDSGDWFPVI